MNPDFWATANLVTKLRKLVQTHKNIPASPPPPKPTAEEEAARICETFRFNMWNRASQGCQNIRNEQYIHKDHIEVILNKIRTIMTEDGFEYRDHHRIDQDKPVMGFGCYDATVHFSDAEGDTMGQLVIEASWLTSGWCLSCGHRHLPD